MISTFSFSEQYFKSNNYKDYLQREEKYKLLVKDLSPILHDLKCKSLLDFGCSIGFLVKHLNLSKFNANGYDCSNWAIEYGKKNYTTKISNNIDSIHKNYDLIFFLDVLEHNSITVINEILSIINTDFLLVRIPVADYGKDFFFFEISRLDETHITCLDKSRWRFLFSKFDFQEFLILNENSIWDSPGAYCAILKKII